MPVLQKEWKVYFTYTSEGEMRVMAQTEQEACERAEELMDNTGMPVESESISYVSGTGVADYADEIEKDVEK